MDCAVDSDGGWRVESVKNLGGMDGMWEIRIVEVGVCE